MTEVLNGRLWLDPGDDLYESIRDYCGARVTRQYCDTPRGTKIWDEVEIYPREVTVNLPDEVIDSCLVRKQSVAIGANGHAIEIRLCELKPDPDCVTGRWLGNFSIEVE